MKERSPRQLLAVAAASLAAATVLRLLLRPRHLFSEDCINFAKALERFDPGALYPHPPGYPLFVLQAQLIHALAPRVETAFLAGVILGTALALCLLVLLGRDVFGSWLGGAIGAVLLAANPSFLYTGLTSTVRIYIAAVTLAVVYCCWRLWRGESRWWPAAALSLGVGSGYRPELLALLFPLWAASAWRGKRDRREFGAGLLLASASAAAWIALLASRFANLKSFGDIYTRYLADQARDFSPLYGASLDGWLRMLGHLAAWAGISAVGWMLFVPLAGTRLPPRAGWFFALWTLPALAFYALVHIGAGDQALSVIPALCLIGGAVISRLFALRPAAGACALALSLGLSVAAFAGPVPLYPHVRQRIGLRNNLLYIRKQIADGLWEVSWRSFRDVNARSEAALRGFAQAMHQSPKNTLVVWSESPVTWRKLSYYYPEVTFCLLLNREQAGNRVHASLWRSARLLKRIDGDPVVVPLGGAERIVWIVGDDSIARKALGGRLRAAAPGGIYWTPAEPVELPGYRFAR